MKHFNWTRITMCLVFVSALAQVWGQSANFTFEAMNPGEVIATHDEWENDNLVYSNGFQAIWGTTIDFSPKHTVYLQSFMPILGGGYTQLWDGMYYSQDYAPFLTFHGLVDDGSQVVVAASQEFDSQVTSFPYVFGVDNGSGAVLWSTPIITGDGVRVSDMQIIQDFSGDFVIGISFQTVFPGLPSPNDWSGLAILKLDPGGNIIFFESVREPGLINEHFRLTDLIQSTISGNYVMSGAYSGNANLEEAFLVEWDQGSGNPLGAPLNLYDFVPGPEEHISVTDDGGEYYLSHYAFNQVIGLAVIDAGFNPVADLVFPPFAGKNNVYTNDIDFDPASGNIELMLTMQDGGGVFSTGFGRIPPGLGGLSAREFDYAPGFKEGYPVAYTSLQPSGIPAASYLFLTHPTIGAGIFLPFPSNDEYLRVLDSSPTSCIPVNGYFETPFGLPFNVNFQGLTQDNQFAPIFDQPVQDMYDGEVYDCNLNPTGIIYKKGDVEPELTISLMPNPVQNSLQLDGDLSDFSQMELYDLTGRIVKSEAIGSKLSVAELAPGVYNLTLVGDSRRETLKFVKE